MSCVLYLFHSAKYLAHRNNSAKFDTERAFKEPLRGLIVMQFNIDKYLTESIIQSPSPPAALVIHNLPDFWHHLPGKFHLCIVVLFSRHRSGLEVQTKTDYEQHRNVNRMVHVSYGITIPGQVSQFPLEVLRGSAWTQECMLAVVGCALQSGVGLEIEDMICNTQLQVIQIEIVV